MCDDREHEEKLVVVQYQFSAVILDVLDHRARYKLQQLSLSHLGIFLTREKKRKKRAKPLFLHNLMKDKSTEKKTRNVFKICTATIMIQGFDKISIALASYLIEI